mgnify:CR=1 FL=1
MKILIVDGQGGGIGRQLVEALKREGERDITCVGTNAIATSAMLRAGAARAATGENAVAVACREAEGIAGPVGIVIADALFGEITPKMALSVGQSSAKRIFRTISQPAFKTVFPDRLAALLWRSIDGPRQADRSRALPVPNRVILRP